MVSMSLSAHQRRRLLYDVDASLTAWFATDRVRFGNPKKTFSSSRARCEKVRQGKCCQLYLFLIIVSIHDQYVHYCYSVLKGITNLHVNIKLFWGWCAQWQCPSHFCNLMHARCVAYNEARDLFNPSFSAIIM